MEPEQHMNAGDSGADGAIDAVENTPRPASERHDIDFSSQNNLINPMFHNSKSKIV